MKHTLFTYFLLYSKCFQRFDFAGMYWIVDRIGPNRVLWGIATWFVVLLTIAKVCPAP